MAARKKLGGEKKVTLSVRMRPDQLERLDQLVSDVESIRTDLERLGVTIPLPSSRSEVASILLASAITRNSESLRGINHLIADLPTLTEDNIKTIYGYELETGAAHEHSLLGTVYRILLLRALDLKKDPRT